MWALPISCYKLRVHMLLMTYVLDLSLRVVGDLATVLVVVHSGDTKGCGAVRFSTMPIG